ncbi:hypothetical protein O6H91_08G005400 [Diphasiastrum complanatum]|uniref:Uncharacterized protein n=2 Tax=Diphasiastrum complanatum TaxID=34168 RepID=A0ACC2CVH0_DIPCM|nr:hypothetical protein O6H91_08G005400 [Diphasiastrum complanatum]
MAALRSELRNGSQWLVYYYSLVLIVASTSLSTVGCNAAAAACRAGDRQALLSFKEGFNDSRNILATWVNGTDCCGWVGVECDSSGRVVSLTVQGPIFDNGLPFVRKSSFFGKAGASLGSLAALQALELSFVNFAGSPIPDEFGKLVNLKSLRLESTHFGGGLPKAMGKLVKLENLRIVDNSLPHPLPVEFCQLTQLQTVDVEINQITGSLPSCLNAWKNVTALTFSRNDLGGEFPSWLQDLHSLTSLDLRENRFSGAIPSTIAQYLPNLQSLLLSKNLLSGGIPTGLGTIAPLISLQLDQNGLSGSIPPSLGDLHQLFILDLSNNHLTGSIPRELGKLTALRFLTLQSNNLTGSIPSELGNLKRDVTISVNINVSNNYLSGSIPPSLANLDRGFFTADNNLLTGAFPVGLLNLTSVSLSHNQLSSLVPSSPLPSNEVFDMYSLDLSFNHIQGSIPEWLSASRGLVEVHLNNNNLSGGIPVSLLALPQLQLLNLSNNPLHVVLPEPASGSGVTTLDLQSTGLHGQITSKFFSSFPSLFKLFLQNNHLSGQLPSDIGSVANVRLSALDLAYNNLTGNVPTSIRKLKFLKLLDLSHNQFTGNVPHLP